MNLSKLYGIDINIDEIVYDTRDITSSNTLFFCINELSYNYIDAAALKGAKVFIVDREIDNDVDYVVVDDVLMELSRASNLLNNNPTNDMSVIAVTGTDGKTTTSQIIQNIFRKLEGKCGYVGTNGIIYDGFSHNYECTVPFSPILYKKINDMKSVGESKVVLEATSHGLAMRRVEHLVFDRLVLTNFTKDHLDYHKTIENYLNAKLHAVDLMSEDGILVLNADDIKHVDFSNKANGKKVYTYALNADADFKAINIKSYTNKMTFDVLFEGNKYYVETNLVGKFNVYNTLAAIATVYTYGYELNKFVDLIKFCDSIEGRSMFVENDLDIDILIDFAHTSNGVENVLSFLKSSVENTEKKIISLMGTPGRRDASKRPSLGKILTTYSDYVIFTTDDPRDEDPNKIIDEMSCQVVHNNYERIIDRKEAIKRAISIANKGDVVALLGKGSEPFFALNGKDIPYLEEDVVKSILENINK